MGDAPGRPRRRWMRSAASPMRIRPATIIGLAASAPPDGLIVDVVAEAEGLAQDELLVGERRVQLGDVDGPSPTPACSAASRVDGESGEVAHAEACGSMRWSMPRIQAGRSHSARARSPAARITAPAPSVIGGQSCVRSGSTSGGSARSSSARAVPGQLGVRVGERRRRRLRAATSARSRSVGVARVEEGAGLQRGEADRRRATAGRRSTGRAGGSRTSRTVAERRLAEAVDERGVDLAVLEPHPGLVQRPGAVHLDVATPRSAARRRRRRAPSRSEKARPAR